LETAKAIKVLVVDDDHALRGVTSSYLRKSGFEVEVAINGVQGLECTRKMRPDIIVSDIMMPEMDGIEFLTRVRQDEALKDMYVILLTAKDRTADMIEGFNATADDYVTKPFKMAELGARVKAAARLKKAQDELRESNVKLREALLQRAELLGIAAHEMRNPISVITIYASLIGQKIVSEDVIKDVCLRRAENVSKLIDNVLDITKIDAGLINIRVQKADVCTLLRETLALYKPAAAQKNITIKTELPENLEIFCDAERVQEIFNTLFESIVRVTQEDGTIKTMIQEDEEQMAFSLESTGGGFEPGKTALIYKAPAKEDKNLEGYEPGTLIGLAIVKKLVDLMGGSVFVHNFGPDSGTCFGFRLPHPADDSREAAGIRCLEAKSRRHSF
jgi:signal transduction histidine kinase